MLVRTQVLVWLVVMVATTAACTSEKALPEPVEVETCEGLEDVGVQLVEVWIDVVDQLPFDDIMTEPPPPEIQELGRIGGDLDQRAARLGCDVAALNAAIRERVAAEELDPETPVGEMLLEMIGEGLVGVPPPTVTTSTGPPTTDLPATETPATTTSP